MDVYEAIEKRCSVRAYQAREVQEDTLLRVLNAGRLAPSARNLQTWKFVVVRDPEVRARLAEAAEQPFVGEAPVVVAVVALDPDSTMFCGIPRGPVDCAIAIDHMTLAAVTEGLGTCWIGHFAQDACKAILNVPESAKIIEMMVLGYPASPGGAKSRKPLEEIVCYDRFDG